MRKRVCIETTIVSYLASRPSRDLIHAARQQITRDWWERRRARVEVFISEFVLDEAREGDEDAARRRLALLAGVPLLDVTPSVDSLAEALLFRRVLPARAAQDALHVAVAAVHGMDVLLTWNCRHLANAEIMGAIADVVRDHGYAPPILCTPEALLGD